MYLIDNNKCIEGGHNLLYIENLCRIKNTIKYNRVVKFVDYKNNPIKACLQRKEYFKYFRDKDFIHILYLDKIYMSVNIFKDLYKSNVKIIATLHWYPSNVIKKNFLKMTSKYIDTIIVHSEYIKEKLAEIGINNVKVIDYPAFIPEKIMEELKNKKNKNEKIVISCLGGTRYDKGLDILVEAFKYLGEDVKNKVIFNVVGKEEDIKYEYLNTEAKKNKINITIENKILTELEYWKNINKSDVILLPYRKIFTGNSGPMTDGIYTNKYILGPNEGNLGYLINKHNLGGTFKSEDSEDLAKTISELLNKDIRKKHEYSKKLLTESFIEKHRILYQDIIKNK